jgi:hypothetical protein
LEAPSQYTHTTQKTVFINQKKDSRLVTFLVKAGGEMNIKIKYMLFTLVMWLLLGSVVQASLVFQLDKVSSLNSPAGNGPWLTATFETIAQGTVRLTLQSNLADSSERFYYVAFNMAQEFYFGNLPTITQEPGTPQATIINETGVTIQWTPSTCSSSPDCYFNNADVNTYLLQAPGLTAEAFNVTGQEMKDYGGMGTGFYWPFWMKSHIGAFVFGPNYEQIFISDIAAPIVSPVPIPAAFWLLGSGLLGLIGFRKKFRK